MKNLDDHTVVVKEQGGASKLNIFILAKTGM